MSQQRYLLALGLLAVVGCGRGPVQSLGPGLGQDGSVRDGTAIADGDVTSGPDASPGTDAGPVFDGGALADAATRDAAPTPDGGETICRFPPDCYNELGEPPPCPDRQGIWECVRNRCEASCAGCNNDCDCDFTTSCFRGQCQPINRPNLCCLNPNCPPGQSCVQPNGGSGICQGPPSDGGVPVGDGGPSDGGPSDGGLVPVDGGVSPADAGTASLVGAPCMNQMMCGPQGFCIDVNQGFPDGYCTQGCGRGQGMCPVDSECLDFGPNQSLCLDSCLNNSECRTGYGCVQLGLSQGRVCWPINPGSTNPAGAPVGSACQQDNACASGLTCLTMQGWPGGYCSKTYCDPQNNPCPSQSSCYAFPGLYSLCLADCPSGGTQSTCRNDYYCFGASGQPGACFPN